MKPYLYRVLTFVALLTAAPPCSYGYYIGQRSRHSDTPSGFGAEFESKYNYFGDVGRGKPEGKGLMIAGSPWHGSKGSISNCPGAVVYYGGWLKGKKEGHGRCYGSDGKLIYEGMFSSDKPAGAYPSAKKAASAHSFGRLKMGKETYTGEISGGKADGFGVVADSRGNYRIGRFKAGRRSGVSLIVNSGSSTWQVVDNNEVIADSREYSKNKADYDAKRKKSNAEAMAAVSKSLADLSQSLNELADVLHGSSGGKSSAEGVLRTESVGEDSPSSERKQSKSDATKEDRERIDRENKMNRYMVNNDKIVEDYGNKIMDFRINPHLKIGQGYSYSEYVSFIKDCQKKAKNINQKYRELSGGKDMPAYNSYRKEFEWAPNKNQVYREWKRHSNGLHEWKD